MEEVRKALKDRRLGIIECYQIGGRIFKNFLIEEKRWLIPVFLLSSIIQFFIILMAKYSLIDSYTGSSEQPLLINLLVLILNAVLSAINLFVVNRITVKIEKKSELSAAKIIFKMAVLIILSLTGSFFSDLLRKSPFSIFIGIAYLVIHFNTLFWFEKYITRDIHIMEALEKGYVLCKGNRLKSIGVVIITGILFLIITFITLVAKNEFIIGIMILIIAALSIYGVMVWTVFYLNIEYEYGREYDEEF